MKDSASYGDSDVSPFLLESSPLELLGDVGKYCDNMPVDVGGGGRGFVCLACCLCLLFMVGGSPTAQIPLLTSVIMRGLTGIDLQNDGLTMGRELVPKLSWR